MSKTKFRTHTEPQAKLYFVRILEYVNKSSTHRNVTEEKPNTSYWKINWSVYQYVVRKASFQQRIEAKWNFLCMKVQWKYYKWHYAFKMKSLSIIIQRNGPIFLFSPHVVGHQSSQTRSCVTRPHL
jgi:hypothetical protein